MTVDHAPRHQLALFLGPWTRIAMTAAPNFTLAGPAITLTHIKYLE
jgi:hypothetical protein